ncbi:MAG TPA: ABC transporter permease [Candidatus Acidoferrum sp.]|jgi:ribose transport system permease protein|nr:ABC transporter permease [Candidatus Acidoferrum sp.]
MSYRAGQTDGTLLKWPSIDPLKPGPEASPDVAARPKAGSRQLLNLVGPCLGLLLVIGLFSLSPTVRPFFLTGANFKIILTQTVIVAVGTLGMTIIIVSGGIDLSVGSVVALASVVGASVLAKGQSSWLAAGLSVAVGVGVGLLNGLVIGGLRMMPFIVTLGMMGVARGAAKWLAGNQTVSAPDSPLNSIMDLKDPTHLFPVPLGVWLTLGLALVMGVVMRRTVFGRYIFALGSNETAARLCGIRVQLQKVIIYSVAGIFFGLAGLMQFSRLTQGDPTVAIGLELDIIAAVVIGGASLSGGSGSILGSMIGALTMAVLRNGSNQMGWPTYMQEIIIGVVIIIAVGVDRLRQSGARRSRS